MVHPDVDVPRLREALDPRDEDRELLRPLRQVRREDPLRLLQPRDVGVGVHREPVGAEREDLVDAVGEPLERLAREAVDQVEVQRLVAELAGGVDERLRHLEGLDAVDELLDLRVEVLHPHRDPVPAVAAEDGEVLGRRHPRVDLDRDLGARCRAEGVEEVRRRGRRPASASGRSASRPPSGAGRRGGSGRRGRRGGRSRGGGRRGTPRSPPAPRPCGRASGRPS